VALSEETKRSRGARRGSATIRLTVGQALLRFLAAQFVERDGIEHRFFGGCFGIFGHGNVAGIGQALHQHPDLLTYYQARNEQSMVHAAVGYARMRNRLGALACTTSIGPGATNMVTGAALATINRLPVLLLPGDIFATRRSEPVLQQLEVPARGDISVNDCFVAVSRYFDRIWRPEQLVPAALAAMRVLTSPAETGAATLALPQDVQAEAYEWPEELFEHRVWYVPRTGPDDEALGRAVAAIRSARRPLIVAGGGVVYSEATHALARLADLTGIPVAVTQAGTGSLLHGHPLLLGAVGATGTLAANRIARDADLVVGVGTRWTDFTTASNTAFPDAEFVSINVAEFDSAKRGTAITADARAALEALADALGGWSVDSTYREEAELLVREWDEEVDRLFTLGHAPLPAQSEVIGAVNAAAAPDAVVVCAAGSMPGDLVKLWRTRDPQGYHVEYGYSCMGYEIAGGLGAKLAAPERDVYILVGDGSYLMLAQEIATAVQERLKLTIVLVDNHGFSSIGGLSRAVGAHGFGTQYRVRSGGSLGLDDDENPGPYLPVDLAGNAQSLGARVLRARTVDELRDRLEEAKTIEGTVVVYVEVDRYAQVPSYESWWDVPVAEVSEVPEVKAARAEYEQRRRAQRQPL
jgi:3D-(3,5/4)-trihydroxycyclohexane-1,2-dione acylhydrolase (decyclizing)